MEVITFGGLSALCIDTAIDILAIVGIALIVVHLAFGFWGNKVF